MVLEKMEAMQKYHIQEVETMKLDYETRIMELHMKLEENKATSHSTQQHKVIIHRTE